MAHLMKASNELFKRRPDERFNSFGDLFANCKRRREESEEHWCRSLLFDSAPGEHSSLSMTIDDTSFKLNEWSFSQLCRLGGVSKDTLNKLSPGTASLAMRETLPRLRKPFQVYASDETARAVHGTAYTRLYDEEVLTVLNEFQDEFAPPPRGMNGGTGLYAGEQDMFCFLIDETSRVEVRGESFAPGMFVWNSEVGKRSVGISTFWYQHVCQNHIVWDAIDVVELTRKHTTNVHRSLDEIRRAIDQLISVRDERKDAFATTVDKAMDLRIAADTEEASTVLRREGIRPDIIRRVLSEGADLTVFGVVDAITRLARDVPNAGDRLVLDSKAASLLASAV